MCKAKKVKCHNQLLSNKHLLPKVTTFNKCKVNKVKCQLQISEALKSVALLPTECAQSVGDKATLRRAPRSHPYKGLNRCARKAAPTQPMLENARICQMQHILACVQKTVVSELLEYTSVHTQQIGMQSIVLCLAKVFLQVFCGENVNSNISQQ